MLIGMSMLTWNVDLAKPLMFCLSRLEQWGLTWFEYIAFQIILHRSTQTVSCAMNAPPCTVFPKGIWCWIDICIMWRWLIWHWINLNQCKFNVACPLGHKQLLCSGVYHSNNLPQLIKCRCVRIVVVHYRKIGIDCISCINVIKL